MIDWLIDWLIVWLIVCLIDWSIVWLIYQLIDETHKEMIKHRPIYYKFMKPSSETKGPLRAWNLETSCWIKQRNSFWLTPQCDWQLVNAYTNHHHAPSLGRMSSVLPLPTYPHTSSPQVHLYYSKQKEQANVHKPNCFGQICTFSLENRGIHCL